MNIQQIALLLGNVQRQCLKIASAHDTAHDIVGGMSEMLSVSQRTVERDISMMKEKGILRREGKDNDGVWVIVDLK